MTGNTYGIWNAKIEGRNIDIDTVRITTNKNSDAGGITVVVWYMNKN